jgi:effector-binding domain-containing protein
MADRDRREVTHKSVDGMLFAFSEVRTENRMDLLKRAEELRTALGDRIVGPPTILLHWATGQKGVVAWVGFPVDRRVKRKGIETTRLEPVEVLSIVHMGPYDKARETYLHIFDHLRAHGLLGKVTSREQVLDHSPDDPDATLVEVQWPLHDWLGILGECLEKHMGAAVRDEVLRGVEEMTVDTPKEERRNWTLEAIRRFEAVANGEEQFECLSRCADEFSQYRIAGLRAIYRKTRSVDAVLEEMRKDFSWYEGPRRKGRVVYVSKIPFDPEGLKAARTPKEARRARCHCNLIRDHLDEVPSAYCWCGAGWYRQQWEGILGKPVRITLERSLARGDDECVFAIHLPDGVKV